MYASMKIVGNLANVKEIDQRTNDNGELIPAHKVFQFLTLDDKGLKTVDVKDKDNKVKEFKVGTPLELNVRTTQFKGNIYYSVV